MDSPSLLLASAFLLPALMLLLCLWRRPRDRMPALLWLAPLPALASSWLGAGARPIMITLPALDIAFAFDLPGVLLLGPAALLWSLAGLYAASYLRGDPNLTRFAEFWLLTLIGSLGVFVAMDLATFYLFFAVASLAAYGLVAHDGTRRARRAAMVYISLAVLGEACLLAAFALLWMAAPAGSLLISDAVRALPGSPNAATTFLLLLAGFGLKAGLVPLHVWLPLAHPAAPMPASAVLSGAIVKAGIIGLIRFLPFEAGMPSWGAWLVTAGFLTAFYAVAMGVTQRNPKTVLAYSTVSQMGVVTALLGLGLGAADPAAAVLAAYYGLHHMLAKGALFLGVGVAMATGAARLRPVMLLAALLAIGLGGLPFTGGALAKLAVKDVFGHGVPAMLAALSAMGTTLLMAHFLRRFAVSADADAGARAPPELMLPFVVTALAALAVPWVLFSRVTGQGLEAVLTPYALWSALWPVLLGLLAVLALRRWEARLPCPPEGDIIALGAGAIRGAAFCSAQAERLEGLLQRWGAATLLLAALVIALAVTMGR